MSAWLWVPTIWLVVATITVPASVGKSRKPMTGGVAGLITTCSLVLIFCILKGGGLL